MYAVTLHPIHTVAETVPVGTVLPYLQDGEHYVHVLLPVTGKRGLVPTAFIRVISKGEARAITMETKIRAFLAKWLREKARLELQTWSSMLSVKSVVWCTVHAAAEIEAVSTRAPETALLILAVRYAANLIRDIEKSFGVAVEKTADHVKGEGKIKALPTLQGWYLRPPEPEAPERKPWRSGPSPWIPAKVRPGEHGGFDIMMDF